MFLLCSISGRGLVISEGGGSETEKCPFLCRRTVFVYGNPRYGNIFSRFILRIFHVKLSLQNKPFVSETSTLNKSLERGIAVLFFFTHYYSPWTVVRDNPFSVPLHAKHYL